MNLLLVGTARSGTTLAQRVLCQNVSIAIPPETHFFNIPFVRYLQGQATFPLDRNQICQILKYYDARRASKRAGFPVFHGVDTTEDVRPDPDRMLMPGLEISTIVDLFERFVEALVPPTAIVGEKTPFHLSWARRLLAERPSWRAIVIVRDPRGVVSSHLRAAFRSPPVELLALRWRLDQQEARQLAQAYPTRTLLVRYESLVQEPTETNFAMLKFCGADVVAPTRQPTHRLFHSWETWKGTVSGPLLPERASAWQTELSAADVARVDKIVGTELERHGYEGVISRRAIDPILAARLLRFCVKRYRLRRFVSCASI